MEKFLFFSIFFLLAIIYFIVGYIVSRSVKSVEDYFLASRNLNVFQVAIFLISTQLGGGFILGTAKEAYTVGYLGLLYVLGICIGFIGLAIGIASRLRELNVVTTAEIFETHYNSIFLKKIASLCSILSLIGIFTAQIIGSKQLLASLNINNTLVFIVFWIFIILYAMIGGLKAIVQNDIFQLSFKIVVFLGIFLYEFFTDFSGFSGVLKDNLNLFKMPVDWHFSNMLIIPLMPALYSFIEQDLAQVFFAAKNKRTATIGAWAAAIFLMFFAFIPLYFGMKAKIIGIDLIDQGNPLMSLFDQKYSSIIVSLVTYGVFAAIISSANGVLCAISSNIVQDFNLTDKNSKHQLWVSKGVMILVGITGIFLAFKFNNLIKVLIDSYAVPVTALFTSLLFVYLMPNAQKKYSTLAAYFSVFSGLFTFFILLILNKSFIISAELDGLIVSIFGYFIGYYIDKLRK